MIAHLGHLALAASVLIAMIWFMLSVVFFSCLNAISILVSQAYGAKNWDRVGQLLAQGFWLALIVVFLIFSVLQLCPWLLSLTHHSPEFNHLAMAYLHGMLFWIPSLTFMIMLEQVLIGLGETHVVMWVSGILVPLQLAFIYAFTFGYFGFPNSGISGPGYGIALGDSLGMSGVLLFMLCAKKMKPYQLFSDFKFRFNLFCPLVSLGLPMGLMSFIEVSSFTAATFIVAYFGAMQLAAHRILLQYLGLLITVVFAMSQAVTVRMGHALGAKSLSSIKDTVTVGISLGFCFVFVLSLMLYFLPKWLLHFDMDTQAVTNQALILNVTHLFHITAVLLLFDNFRIIGFGILRGVNDTAYPMWISLISFWFVGLPVAYELAFRWGLGDAGVWLGLTAGIVLGAFLVMLRVRFFLRHPNRFKLVLD